MGYGMKDYYEFLHKCQSFLYTGETENPRANYFYGESDLPSYPDVFMTEEVTGVSRKVLDAGIMSASRLMGSDPLPKWEEVDDMTREFRTEAFLKRFREMRMDRETLPTFLDGYFFGVGATLHGFVTDESGLQKVDAQNIPAHCLAWDPLVPSPEKSSWVAATIWMHPDEAEGSFPGKIEGRTCSITSQSFTRSVEAVRVVIYYHKGEGMYEPTYCVFAGPIEMAPVVHRNNPWGGKCPFSFNIGHILPGFPRPVGSVWLQAPSQIVTNEAERDALSTLMNGMPMDIFDPSDIDTKDFDKWRKKQQRFVKRKGQSSKPMADLVHRVPAQGIEASTIQLLQYYDERQIASGGASQLESGQPMGVETATEASILQNQIQQNQGHTTRQAALYLSSFVTMMADAMKLGDRSPCPVEWDGDVYTINDPEVPELWMDQIFDQPSLVSVDSDNMTSAHNSQKQRAKASDLIALIPMLQGQVPIEPVLEEVFKNLGFGALWEKVAAQMQAAQQAQPMQQGMPPEQMPGMPQMA